MSISNIRDAKTEALRIRMGQLGVREKDLDENYIRSSGPGGQKVNKTSSCVFLRHIPTGIFVKCQKSRSQILNRFVARRRLLDLIEKRRNGFIERERKRIAKIRKQKCKRSKRAKEKMLANKHIRSEKKEQRKSIRLESLKNHE